MRYGSMEEAVRQPLKNFVCRSYIQDFLDGNGVYSVPLEYFNAVRDGEIFEKVVSAVSDESLAFIQEEVATWEWGEGTVICIKEIERRKLYDKGKRSFDL